jgi:hypothetical protein
LNDRLAVVQLPHWLLSGGREDRATGDIEVRIVGPKIGKAERLMCESACKIDPTAGKETQAGLNAQPTRAGAGRVQIIGSSSLRRRMMLPSR